MPENQPNLFDPGVSAASVAQSREFVKNFQAEQAKGLAITSAPLVLRAAVDANRRAEATQAYNAEMLEGQFQIRKQLWIQNQLLAGWSMEDINEEIAAGEALLAERTAEQQSAASMDDMIQTFLWLGVIAAAIIFVVWSFLVS